METIKKTKRVFSEKHKQRLKNAARNRGKKQRQAKELKIVVVGETKQTDKKLSLFQKIKNGIKTQLNIL